MSLLRITARTLNSTKFPPWRNYIQQFSKFRRIKKNVDSKKKTRLKHKLRAPFRPHNKTKNK